MQECQASWRPEFFRQREDYWSPNVKKRLAGGKRSRRGFRQREAVEAADLEARGREGEEGGRGGRFKMRSQPGHPRSHSVMAAVVEYAPRWWVRVRGGGWGLGWGGCGEGVGSEYWCECWCGCGVCVGVGHWATEQGAREHRRASLSLEPALGVP